MFVRCECALQTGNRWPVCAPSLGHLRLREACVMARLQQCIEEHALRRVAVVLDDGVHDRNITNMLSHGNMRRKLKARRHQRATSTVTGR